MLTDAEIRQLLAHPDADLEMKMLVMLSRTVGGMRAGDLDSLEWTAFSQLTIVRDPMFEGRGLVYPESRLDDEIRRWEARQIA